MINAVAPRTHQSRAAFGNANDGVIKQNVLNKADALPLFEDVLATFKYKNLLKKGSFDNDEGCVKFQVHRDAYDNMAATIIKSVGTVGATGY
jgi:hypothetical protein